MRTATRRHHRQLKPSNPRRLVDGAVRLARAFDAWIGTALESRAQRSAADEARSQMRGLFILGACVLVIVATHVVAHWNLYFHT